MLDYTIGLSNETIAELLSYRNSPAKTIKIDEDIEEGISHDELVAHLEECEKDYQ